MSRPKMSCFRKGNKTGPEVNHRIQRHYTPGRPKVNGWSWPPHPYQILSWIAYLYFLIIVVGIFIPLLPLSWIPAGYIWLGVVFTWHLAFYVISATIDPAEDSVRDKGYKKLPPVFNRKTRKTCIRNRYCRHCKVHVAKSSKHCTKCNKCVFNFDHHCKLLNNCVGSRNYRYFLGCVISAVLGNLVIITISGFVFVGFFINPKLLRSSPEFGLVNDANTWLVFLPYFSVHTNITTILVLAVVTIGLSLTALILLCLLLFFHFYLMWKRLSTHEYTVLRRQRQMSKVSPQNDDDIEALRLKANQNTENVASHPKDNTHVHFESTSTDGSTSRYHQDAFRIEDESLPTVPSDRNQARIKKISQKKQRRKMSAGRIKHKAATKRPFRASQLPPALAAAFQSPVLSLQAFPSPLSMSTVRSVRAAGPPAEYHSDSAESMNEIPVVQTRLGSAAAAMQTSTTFHSTEDSFGNSLQTAISKECHNKGPDQPTTSKKSKGLGPSVEQFYRDPPVNERE
ncbi:palmitoyltransferase ZDHHC1-like isoform X2 [Hemitrygon akajei]|uniref:palmitoyltransferase ZDHHC1-like isoform X2 n=1 Tax=Hemitrygon akajei TaxID=2704970 RepID=UPI003BF95F9D